MKKYLMMGAVALLMGASFTSCSKDKDLYDPQANAMKFLQDYQNAFIQAFGTPAAQQSWGFGTTTAGSRMTRAINSNWDGWVSAPTDDEFASDFPEDVIGADQYYNYTNQVRKNYKFDSNKSQTINFWVGNANIYVDGEREIDFKNPGDGNPGITYYILPGANVTFLSDYTYNNANNHAMYVSAGATVTFAGKMSSNVNIYNRGTIVVNDATGPYAQGVIFNEGTFTSKGHLAVYNNGAQVVNVGTWTVADGMTVEGSGHFRNLGGTMTITGNTLVNSNECSWINDATFITDYFTYNAGSHDVINNCKLIVNQDFNYTIGDGTSLFKMDGGSSVVTKNFSGSGPFRVDMGSKSVFKVTNNCYLDATASGIVANGYGFHGVGNDYAVLQAKNVTNHGNPGHGYTVYGGKLYVSAESHFAQGTEGAAAGASYIIFQDGCTEKNIYAPGFESGKPAIKIEETPCNPGFDGDDTPTPPTPPYNDTPDYRIIAEDLTIANSGNDFDFNDVVFDVYYNNLYAAKAKIVLKAAGGTLPLQIRDANGVVCEVHDAFGVSVSTMVNTNAGPWVSDKEFEVAIDKSVYDDNIKIFVDKSIHKESSNTQLDDISSFIELTALKGHVAAKIKVDATYEWCQERTDINACYPNFAESEGSYVTTPANYWPNAGMPKWWATKKEGAKLVTR